MISMIIASTIGTLFGALIGFGVLYLGELFL